MEKVSETWRHLALFTLLAVTAEGIIEGMLPLVYATPMTDRRLGVTAQMIYC